MKLTKEQIKIAKTFCKENSINPKRVVAEIGNGAWIEDCNSSFEGYLSYLKSSEGRFNGSVIAKAFEASTARYRAGKSGMISLNK